MTIEGIRATVLYDAVLDSPDLTAYEKLVLMAIASLLDEPSVSGAIRVPDIAHRASADPRHVRRVINNLIKNGYLTRELRGTAPSVYGLTAKAVAGYF